MHSRNAWLAMLVLSPLGCYTYRGVELAEVPIGTEVRARLTPNEAARVGDILGVESRVVEGELMDRSDAGTVTLRVATSAATDVTAHGRTYQRIAVPAAAVQELEARRLDRSRTGALLGVGAAALTYAVTAAFVAQRQPDPGPGKGGTNALRVP